MNLGVRGGAGGEAGFLDAMPDILRMVLLAVRKIAGSFMSFQKPTIPAAMNAPYRLPTSRASAPP